MCLPCAYLFLYLYLYAGDCNDEKSQQWKGGGKFQWVNQANTGMCLDLNALNTTNGNYLQLWNCESLAEGEATPIGGAGRLNASASTGDSGSGSGDSRSGGGSGGWTAFGASRTLASRRGEDGFDEYSFSVHNASAYINHESDETPLHGT